MSVSTWRDVLELLFFPIIITIVTWTVTGRKKDQATIRDLLSKVPKQVAEGTVAEGTVHAAIELADTNTLHAGVKAMADAFSFERESLTRRIDDAERRSGEIETRLDQAQQQLSEAYELLTDFREDQRRCHREMLDMYRRDQYHAHAVDALTSWAVESRRLNPSLPDPPRIDPLPTLYPPPVDDMPRQRFYDQAPDEEDGE